MIKCTLIQETVTEMKWTKVMHELLN